ncbi:usp family protein [Schizosaccharomyces cryophilus OY26]|uniref:Usp family protein n=1 Tax=Schizosaccharomyces cryophilus (strain OY26 / ATCC MYA-4695 / CBS 11777 / NBRC 106824 / NRRL Y48691) TaxID=653667 RepID=S9XB83_SCHCR|nr:usp family protein [Schizosaccharomyces cryophilus OY26]EPY51001.1 usp family protein [Schizosaccharomyces cryophilus OY26]
MTSKAYGGNSLASALDEERLEVLRWMKEREEKKYRELALDYDPIVRDYCFVKPGEKGYRIESADMTSLPHYKNPPISDEYKKKKEKKEKKEKEDEKKRNISFQTSNPLAMSSNKVSDVLASSLFSTESPPSTSHKRHSLSSITSKSSSPEQTFAALHPYGESHLKKPSEPTHQRRASFGSIPSTSSSVQRPSISTTITKSSQKEAQKASGKSRTTPSSPVTKPFTSPDETSPAKPDIPHFVVSPPPVSSTSGTSKTAKDGIHSPAKSDDALDENDEPLHLTRSLPSSSSSSEDEDEDGFSSHSDVEGLPSPNKPFISFDDSPKVSQPLINKSGKASKRSRLKKLVGAPLSKRKSLFDDDSNMKGDSNVLRRSRSNPGLSSSNEVKSEPVRPNTNFVSTHVDNWYGSDQEEIEQDLRTAKSLDVNVGPTRWIPNASRTIRRIRRGNFQSAASNSKRNSTYFLTLDLSSESLYAAEWAAGVLLRNGDTLIIVDVIECDDPKLEMEHMESSQMETLEKITKYILKLLSKTVLEIEVNIEVIHHEKAKHLIVEMIDYVEPTLVVMGSRGRSHLKGVLLGSFSNYLVNKSSVPVMVARKRLRKNKHRFERSDRLANNLADAIVDEVGR